MGFRDELELIVYWIARLLWHLLHGFVTLWCIMVSIATAIESYLISSRVFRKYNLIDTSKLRYLAIVIDSEEAREVFKIVELLQWLSGIGVKKVCLFDPKGLLKQSKEKILASLGDATLFEEADRDNSISIQSRIVLEFTSLSDGKEAVVKAANVVFQKYMKLDGPEKAQARKLFTESQMNEALISIGCRGPEPDLLLVYGPVRCHLGFPAWRIRYTEIIHMGTLKSMRYGALIKAIYKFTIVRQNYGV